MTTNADLLLSAANYVDSSKVVAVAGTPTFGGAALVNFNPLYSSAGIPGVSFRFPIADTDGNIDSSLNSGFLSQLDSLWHNRLAETSFFTSDQVRMARGLIALGVIVAPVNQTTIHNLDPAHDARLFEPANLGQGTKARSDWDAVCLQFKNIVSTYIKGQAADARAQGKALEDNVAFWANIYAKVEAAQAAVASVVTSSLLGLLPYAGALVLIGIVGFVLYAKGSAKLAAAAVKA